MSSEHGQDAPRRPQREAMEFISEPIEPERGSFDPEMMSRGLAALPRAFTWRGERYEVVACLDHQKVSNPTAGGQVYLRRQEFTVQLNTGQHAVLYVVRSPTSAAAAKPGAPRWFVYAIEPKG